MRKIVEEKYREDGLPLWKEYLEGQTVSWEKWEYNEAGDLVLYCSSDGDWTKCRYDEQGRIVEELKAADWSGDTRHPRITYDYREDGYVVSKFDPTCDVKSIVVDENGNEQERWCKLQETFVYDNENRLLSYASASGAWAKCQYDEDGKLVVIEHSNGNVYTWPEGYEIQVGDANELLEVGVPMVVSVEGIIQGAAERVDEGGAGRGVCEKEIG